MYREEVLKGAIDHYGHYFQMDQTIEECGELIVNINKIKRFLKGTQWEKEQRIPAPSEVNSTRYSLLYFNLCSEIADVMITTKGMSMMFNAEAVQLSIERKVDRLEDRIKKPGVY